MPIFCLQRVNDTRPDALVRAARAGDNDAWARLVARYDRLLRSVAGSYRLQPSDVDDVVQMTWMRLYGHVDRVRDPAAIAGWLATTARREAMRVLQTHVREQLSDDPELGEDDDSGCPEARVLADEERIILEQAIAVLPDRQRKLLNLLATQPDADYQRISATLEMPHGSIGPTRARGLLRLRQDPLVRRHFSGA
jgi:RNA polymerase sigma factor (sigma-70 family)